MVLLAPLWLMLLIPFAGLVAWLLVRRGTTVRVPFVQLWRGDVVTTTRHGRRRPPLVVVLILTSILLAILAAAGPARRTPGGAVTVLVDRGVTMSVDLRFRSTADEVLRQVREHGMSPRLVPVPAYVRDVDRAAVLPPTAVDTTTLLTAAINDAVAREGGSVVVVTDQDLPPSVDDRVVRVAPTSPPSDRVTIAYVAARSTPVPQAMVRLRNESDATTAAVTVASASSRQVTVDLPPRGQTRDYFLDSGPLSTNISVTVGDGLGQQAWLALRAARPSVEAVGPVPNSVERAVAAYARARPAGAGGRRIVVTTSAATARAAVEGGGAAVLLGDGPTRRATARVELRDHPLTRDLDWRALTRDTVLAGRPPGNFEPIATVAGAPLLAVDGQRQAWVGLRLADDAQSVDWVILWTRLFDWLGDSATHEWADEPPRQLDGDWRRIRGITADPTEQGFWPGLFGHADGRLLAINAPDVRPDRAATSTPDWLARLRSADANDRARSFAPALSVASLALLAAALVRLLRTSS